MTGPLAGRRLGQVALVLAGLGLAIVGVNGLTAPRALLAPLGIPLDAPSALSEGRANYGGMHVGMGLFFLSSAFVPRLRTAALLAATTFMGGLFLGRVVSVAVDGVPDPFVGVLFATELGGAALAAAALALETRRRRA
ncbi:MAG TPA: DUF4345 domain-containing protein [Candidatus Binatia bacterium]|nr:DUF4345 domain-containing protein [Candidatus Binatia bacterium]